ncbi:class I SAM-dependent methyltransferase [Azospirillum sp. B4]|uniref:class I SAM-dependent DNA methyltransferase n=1 Tax=Azospirillum sp. B4 TaxID=95605 RepID=UPI000349A031|nr:class I SAM-dependent methyltransferase [Azospirillum sp. B4]
MAGDAIRKSTNVAVGDAVSAARYPRTLGQGAPDDWDRLWTDYGSARAANPSSAFRTRLIEADLAATGLGPHSRLLDIGCGIGLTLMDLASRFPGTALAGVDASAIAIAAGQARLADAHLLVCDLQGNAEELAPLSGWATHAICSEVLEHVDAPGTLLRHARSAIAPGGVLLVTVPAGPRTAYDRHIGHRRHYSRQDLRELLKEAGFEVERVRASGWPFFNLYKLLITLRGRRLIDDLRGKPSTLARAGITLFRHLFRLQPAWSHGGWQLVAIARRPLAAG